MPPRQTLSRAATSGKLAPRLGSIGASDSPQVMRKTASVATAPTATA